MPSLLVIHHSPTASLRSLTEQVVAGANDDALDGVDVTAVEALAFARGEADHRTILEADGYLLGTSANFGYMSGALKHVFDATFLQIGGALDATGAGDPNAGGTTKGRPFGLFVHGRYDTTGAVRSAGARASRCSRCSATCARSTSGRRTSSAVRSPRC